MAVRTGNPGDRRLFNQMAGAHDVPNMSQYYLRIDGESLGPFTIQQLKVRPLHADTHVWREGLADWIRADQLPELHGLLKPSAQSFSDDLSPYASPSEPAMPYGPFPRSGQLPHSGPGIASLVCGGLVAVAEMIAFIAVIFMLIENPEGPLDEQSGQMMAIGGVFCGGFVLNLVGGVLGIVGLVVPNRKKLFSILGLSLNALMILGFAGLMLIGLAAG